MSARRLLSRIGEELARRRPRRAELGSWEVEAAVSVLLRPGGTGTVLELLVIKRAESEGDPWSGHMALPGGRREPEDEDLWETAVRETREEVGMELSEVGRRLGQLDDVVPGTRRIPAIVITPFVVAVEAGVEARAGSEVEQAVWLPLDVLFEGRHRGRRVMGAGTGRAYPTIEYEGHVIWGLTFRILSQLEGVLRRVGYPGERR